MNDSAKTSWLSRLAELMRRAGVPVSSIFAKHGVLTFELGDNGASIYMSRPDSTEPCYKSTKNFAYRYKIFQENTGDWMSLINLAIAILTRLEEKLPTDWTAGGPEMAVREFSRRFPFASVDMAHDSTGTTKAQILLRLTPVCNQNCPFCSAPDCAEPADAELQTCIQAAITEFPGSLITLTGGEPTLRKGWAEVLRQILASREVEGVQVQTNAVSFAKSGPAIQPDPRLLWFVSLHAIDEDLYDEITQTKGQMSLAIKGLKNLLGAGHRVIVNVVVGSRNAAHLAVLARNLPELLMGLPLPELHVSVLMCPPHRPESDQWLIPYEELVPLLELAVESAARSGLPMAPLVSSTHASIPPCFVTPEQRAMMVNRPKISKEETGYEDFSKPWVKSLTCKNCAQDDTCLGVPTPYARRFGIQNLHPIPLIEGWRRWALEVLGQGQKQGQGQGRGRGRGQISLGELVGADNLPAILCTRPWTRLELHDENTFGPCCADYMSSRHFAPENSNPSTLWKDNLFKKYRKEMVSSQHPPGCRSTCPILVSGQETLGRFVLTADSNLERQLEVAQAMINGKTEVDHAPLSIGIPVTSFCNYNCLMCDCGEKGTLDDQRSPEFWHDIEKWIVNGTTVDINGGEPLTSPYFRQWIERLATLDLKPSIGLVTNGSLLTPKWIESLPKLPFKSITVSLNAASPKTYEMVNRGVSWTTIRKNLEALQAAKSQGKFDGEIVYSMVILLANLHEIEDFVRLALKDNVSCRFLLPQHNRNNQSIMTSAAAMSAAEKSLRAAADMLKKLPRWSQDATASADILAKRLEIGELSPIGNG